MPVVEHLRKFELKSKEASRFIGHLVDLADPAHWDPDKATDNRDYHLVISRALATKPRAEAQTAMLATSSAISPQRRGDFFSSSRPIMGGCRPLCPACRWG